MKKFLFVFLFVLFLPAITALPQPEGFVNDFADMLSPEEENSLEALIGALEKETTAEIAIVIIPSLEGSSREEYAVELFEQWGIGKEETDNGLLILVALKEQKWKIEVGYGLEGVITDARAGRVARNYIVPNFREGNYFQGLQQATVQFAGLIKQDPSVIAEYTSRVPPKYNFLVLGIYILLAFAIIGASFPPKHKKNKTKKTGMVLGMNGILFFIAFLIGSSALAITFYILLLSLTRLFGHTGRGSGTFFYMGGGRGRFGGGGFGGFGGGMSGGGGAGGGW